MKRPKMKKKRGKPFATPLVPSPDEFTWYVPLDEPASKRTTPEPPPFRASIEHPGGCINVQGLQKAVRLDLLDWSGKRFVWEWMDVETATRVRDALTKAIEAAS